jgi:hypothetical protein
VSHFLLCLLPCRAVIGGLHASGKNRPLTDEELEFFDNLYEQERQQLQQQHEEEAEALEAYRAAVQMAAEGSRKPDSLEVASTSGELGSLQEKGKETSVQRPGQRAASTSGRGNAAKRPTLRAVVKVKPRGQEEEQQQGLKAGERGQPAKKQKVNDDEQAEGAGDQQDGLQGILGDYTSGSDSES